MKIEGRLPQTSQLQKSGGAAETAKSQVSQAAAPAEARQSGPAAAADQFGAAKNAAPEYTRGASSMPVPDTLVRSREPRRPQPDIVCPTIINDPPKKGLEDLIQVLPSSVEKPPKKGLEDLIQVLPSSAKNVELMEHHGTTAAPKGDAKTGKTGGSSETEIKVPEPDRSKPDTSPWGKQPVPEPKYPSMWDDDLGQRHR